MSKCLECGADIKQTEGRRPRKFCDNKGKCRLANWNKNHPKKGKYVLKTTFDKIAMENAAAQMELAKLKMNEKSGASGVRVDINNPNEGLLVALKKESVPYQNPNPEIVDILAQIKAIRAEKIPEHRNTSIGRKTWQIEQNKRVAELELKLKII